MNFRIGLIHFLATWSVMVSVIHIQSVRTALLNLTTFVLLPIIDIFICREYGDCSWLLLKTISEYWTWTTFVCKQADLEVWIFFWLWLSLSGNSCKLIFDPYMPDLLFRVQFWCHVAGFACCSRKLFLLMRLHC